MTVLGISAYFHDSAAALVKDGAVIAAAEEELDEISREMNLPENGTNVELLTKLTGRQEELEEQLLEWYEAVEELT